MNKQNDEFSFGSGNNEFTGDDFIIKADSQNDDNPFTLNDGDNESVPVQSDFKIIETETKSVHESDFHASEHHIQQAQDGTLRESQRRTHSHSSHTEHSSSHSHSSSSKKKKKKDTAKTVKRILLAIFIIILILVFVGFGTFFVLDRLGKKDFSSETSKIDVIDGASSYDNGKTIEYNGHTYLYNDNVISIAALGVDKRSLGKGSTTGSAGQADADMVIALDSKTGKTTVIAIPRDTMTDVDLFSESGIYLRTDKMQLCLAYAYGDGQKTSCENTIKSISRILYGIPINHYFALDLDGIAPINDAIGGVTVTSLYDFTDFGIKKGDSVTIKGSFAETYVRKRDLDNIEASLNRSQRQIQYVKAFSSQAVNAVIKDFGVVSKLYSTASSYSHTNLTLSNVTFLASTVLAKGVRDFDTVSVSGEMKPSSNTSDIVFAEFYPDETALFELVLSIYYEKIN